MAALMRYVVAHQYPTDNFGNLLTALADASLIGSCGNSGMILSAFFVGLSNLKPIAENTALTVNEFIECLKSGVKQAHQSVAHPVEGTILTVMQAWLNACIQNSNLATTFETLFQTSIPIAEAALKQTEFLLPTLKDNHVVDAGAFGFIKLVQGMNLALRDPDKFDVNWEEYETCHQHVAHHAHHTELSPDAYQFCMETLIAGTSPTLHELHQKLEPLCDSIVLNQSPNHIKAHVHTTDLLTCTEILKDYGKIIHQKIDDIKIQWAINEHRKHNIAIVADSSADIPQEIRDTAQIHTIPNQVRVGEHLLLDRLTVNLTNMFNAITQNHLKLSTAAPSAEIVNRYLHFLASHYNSIIVITLSSRLSSAYQLIKNQAEQVSHSTGIKIDVIDSLTLAAGHGLLVMKAAKLLDTGHSHDDTVHALEKARKDIKFYVGIDEMQTMRESGRLSKFMHKIADWGQLKPILSVDQYGNMSKSGLSLGKQKAWKKIVALINRTLQNANQYTLLISHTASPETIQEFVEYLKANTNVKLRAICETASSIGVHAGRGAIAVSILHETL